MLDSKTEIKQDCSYLPINNLSSVFQLNVFIMIKAEIEGGKVIGTPVHRRRPNVKILRGGVQTDERGCMKIVLIKIL